MSGVQWREALLRQIADIERIAARPDCIDPDDVFIGLEHIDGEGNLDETNRSGGSGIASTKFRFTENHVLYGKLRPYLRKIALPNCTGVCSTDILPILPKRGIADRSYLFHYLRQPHMVDLAVSRTAGANLPRLSPSILADFPIRFPLINEQRRIAAILDKADAIRRKRQQALALADDFLRSAFLEMFGDPVMNTKGWVVDALGDHLDYLTSGSRGWAMYYDDDGQDIFIRIGNVGSNQLLMDDLQAINAPENAEARRTRVCPGDVLLSITADLGRTAVVPPNLGSAYINQHLAIIRPKGIEPLFLSQFLASRGGQMQFKQLDRSGVKSGLNFDDIRSLRIPLPPLPMQQRFATLWRRVQLAADDLRSAVQTTNTLFASLSQRAFRGEL